MTPRPFDYPSFRARFHDAAVARGIDPVAGATSYQVALLKADCAKEAKRRANRNWWAHSHMWRHAPPYRNVFEGEAIYRVFESAWALE